MEFEQRKYVRFSAKEKIFAALRDGFNKVGKVNDISIKGMAFSYFGDFADAAVKVQDSQVDIFLENRFHIFNMPCRIIYEVADATLDENFLIKTSKCGLFFGKVTKLQLYLLNHIISKYTVTTRPKNEIAGE